ncbi:relaxase MobL [Mycoplasma sp. 394]
MQELFIDFNFIAKDRYYKTDLGNKHDLNGWVRSGAWVDYYTKDQKVVDFENSKFNGLFGESYVDSLLDFYKENIKKNKGSSNSGMHAVIGGDYYENINTQGLKAKMQKFNGVMYEMVISSNDAMLSAGMVGNEKWKNLVSKNLMKWLQSSGLGFEKENLEIYYAIHGNTEHPHIHLSFFETKTKRNLGRKYYGITKNIAGKKFNELKKSILESFTDSLTSELDLINKELKNVRAMKVMFKKDLLNINKQEYNDAVFNLQKECKTTKNIWYSKLSKESKAFVDEVRNDLYKNSSNFKKVIDDFNDSLTDAREELKNINDKFLYEDFDLKLNKEAKEFNQKINNAIVKELITFKVDNKVAAKYGSKNTKRIYGGGYQKLFNKVDKDIWNLDAKHRKLISLAYRIAKAKDLEEYENIIRRM